MITIIDVNNSFNEASRKNWKKVPIINLVEDMNKKTVNTTVSRYEILNSRMRKVYFDIEKIPADQPDLINEIIVKLQKFYQDKLKLESIKEVHTLNTGSKTHEGLSYHLIFPEICVDYSKQKIGVVEFVNSEEGSQYKDYIDTSVYSSIRLFKLPYYIGITNSGLDTNTDNYHRIITGDSVDFLISAVSNTKRYYPVFHVSSEAMKLAKGFSGPHIQFPKRIAGNVVVQAVIPPTNPISTASQKFTYKWCCEKLERINAEKSKLSPIIQKKVDELLLTFEEESNVNISLLTIYGNIIESIEKKL